MKVLLLNGSPHEKGNTYLSLEEIAKTLKNDGIDSEIFYIGKDSIASCMGCGACSKLQRCVFDKDKVNEFVNKMMEADALIVGSPVHYAGATGAITAFLGRAFFSGWRSGKNVFRLKPAAAVAVARRAGTSSTLDQLNKYFGISQMPVISGRYWNNVHGQTQGEINQDFEGLQNLRFLARNMSYFLKCKEAGQNAGILPPKEEDVTFTNFVRN